MDALGFGLNNIQGFQRSCYIGGRHGSTEYEGPGKMTDIIDNVPVPGNETADGTKSL